MGIGGEVYNPPTTVPGLVITSGKTVTFQNTMTFSTASDGQIYVLPASDTLVGRASTDTLTNKTWNGAIISPVYGGTGINNGTNTITLGASISTSGSFTTTTGNVTLAANVAGSNVTLPASGTLATLTGTETLSNKTLAAPALGTPVSGVLTNCTGTAAGLTAGAATVLATARAINGVNFDGSAAIQITGTGSDNRIVNGDFLVDQINEGTAFTPAATGNSLEGWRNAISGLGSALTFQKQATVIPTNFGAALKILVAAQASPTAAQFTGIQQRIEGISLADLQFGTANAQNVMLSFQARASVTGTYYVSIQNSSAPPNRSYVAAYTVSQANTWAQYNISIPGDTAGTWTVAAGSSGLGVTFDLGFGSNFNTTANAWQAGNFYNVAGATLLSAQANGSTLYLANVRFYPGSVALPYVPLPYAEVYAICRRFYQKSFPEGTAPAQNAGVAGAITVKNPIALGDPSEYVQFIPPMAVTPTITTYNPSAANANWRDITAGADATVSVDPATTVGKTGVLIATSGTVATLGDVLAIHVTAQAAL